MYKTLKIKQHKFFTFSFLFIFAMPQALALFEETLPMEGDVYILANDIIKGFNFDEFNGVAMLGGGAVDNKLKAEAGMAWKLYKEDIELINTYVVGDKKYYYFKVTMRNNVNFHSNYDVGQATDKITPITDYFDLGHYIHYGCFGTSGEKIIHWAKEITFHSYQFWAYGETMRMHVTQNCMLTGTVKMSFDIAERTLPVLEDSEGNKYDNKFTYIGVSSAFTYNTSTGKLSDTNPVINTVLPEEYSDTTGSFDAEGKGETKGYSNKWTPKTALSAPFALNIYGMVQAPTDYASLQPTLRNGGSTYNNTEQLRQSQPDCAIYYNIGKLSPIVTEWAQTLTYTYSEWVTQDGDCMGSHVDLVSSSHDSYSQTRPVAASVNNQYIHSDIGVVFNIFSEYQIQTTDTNEGKPKMGTPGEETTDLWTTIVDGWGGGEWFTAPSSNPFSNLFGLGNVLGDLIGGIITLIILIAIVAVCVIVIKRTLKRKAEKKLIAVVKKKL